MSRNNDINDDEIRIIGTSESSGGDKPSKWWIVAAVILLAALVVGIVLLSLRNNNREVPPQDTDTVSEYFDGGVTPEGEWFRNEDPRYGKEIVIQDTVVNGIGLRIYTPYNLRPELHVGTLDTNDRSILFCTQAADLRADNHKILGAFVYKGEPMAWGLSKRGFCAIINGEINLGVADNSPWFEEATEKGGYFFRQYPLVDNGEAVKNNPENSSIRRTLCSWNGRVCIVATLDPIKMNDFSEMLAQMGVRDAIYLVGSSSAHGWVIDNQGNQTLFSHPHQTLPENINYILFRK